VAGSEVIVKLYYASRTCFFDRAFGGLRKIAALVDAVE
jgi:hypothetical protein